MRSVSTPQINEPDGDMATTVAARNNNNDKIMDTRTPSPVHRADSNESSSEKYKPDLSAEVAMLSTKLVNAINYQTSLDDALQASRHELEQANKELATLRTHKKGVDEQLASGALIQKSTIDKSMDKMRSDLATARTAREAADKAKKETEGELENLTTALFEEANTMVAAARKDTEAVEKRNTQLRSQLNDTELLLASQQEQLRDLKDTMERMERSSEYESAGQRDASMPPSTPIGSRMANFDALQLSPDADAPDVPPEHPLHFAHLLAPIMRQDVTAYVEFQELMLVGARAAPPPHSRQSSSNTNHLTSSSQSNLSASSGLHTSSSNSPSIPGAFSFPSSSSPQSSSFAQTGPTLKESKFYKRTLLEDLEPTLRLDLAPGLNLFSRRTVLSSLLSGSLVVEPFLPSTKVYGPIFACALCGESRKNEPYVRKHRFRTSEEDSAQRYPLCDYCLNRVRASGDFVGFLRMLRDGHWRAESPEEQKSAWEESVKLRERMFWARLGGGVVPTVHSGRRDLTESPSTTAAIKSNRESIDSVSEKRLEKSNAPPLLEVPLPVGATVPLVEEPREELSRRVSALMAGSSVDAKLKEKRVPALVNESVARDADDSTVEEPAAEVPVIKQSIEESDAESGVEDADEATETEHSEEKADEAAPAESTQEEAMDEKDQTAATEDTPTPFEDAQSEVNEPVEPKSKPETDSEPATTNEPTESTETSAQPPTEEVTNPEDPSIPDSTNEASEPPAAAEELKTPPTASEEFSDSASRTVFSSPSDSLSPPTPGTGKAAGERRPSAVLARVRAMEAKNQGST